MTRRISIYLITVAAGLFSIAPFIPGVAQRPARNPQAAKREQEALRGIEKKDIRRGLVIAAATVSIPNEQTLVRTLLPHSTPPDSVVVILNDETAVAVENLEWIENPGTGSMLYRLCMCTCIRGKPFTCAAPDKMTYEQCCDRCCRMRLEGPQPQPYERLSGNRTAEVEASLAQVGLKRASGQKKTYPIDLPLFGSNPNPQQTITCLQKDEQGNCIRWRICGTTTSGVYKCYEIVKDPAFGWVVTW